LRLQSVYRRRRLAEEKAKREHEERMIHAVKALQHFVRSRIATHVATSSMLDLKVRQSF
jgi:hypothetical protein